MSSSWRSAGLNYVNYSNIAARVLRKSLKADLKEHAMKQAKSTIRYFYWSKGEMMGYHYRPRHKMLNTFRRSLIIRQWRYMCPANLNSAEGEKPKQLEKETA